MLYCQNPSISVRLFFAAFTFEFTSKLSQFFRVIDKVETKRMYLNKSTFMTYLGPVREVYQRSVVEAVLIEIIMNALAILFLTQPISSIRKTILKNINKQTHYLYSKEECQGNILCNFCV